VTSSEPRSGQLLSAEAIAAIPLWLALVPVLVLIVLLVLNVGYFSDGDKFPGFGSDATYGANQIALLAAAAVATVCGVFRGTPVSACIAASTVNIASSLTAILILLMIGGLLGTWMISGIIPAMVYYGMQILSPAAFLVLALLICSAVSVATGSSWTTVGCLGVPLLIIGQSMGFNPAVVAGAVISGAYFGDKISPLSDTTNLAPAMAGTDLYTHVRYMFWTTIPTMTITLILFAIMNWRTEYRDPTAGGAEMLALIDREFNLSPWLFAVPVLVIGMVACRIDPVVSLFLAMILGAAVAVAFQPSVVSRLADTPVGESMSGLAEPAAGTAPATDSPSSEAYAWKAYRAAVLSMAKPSSISTGNEQADALLSGRGMEGMLNTIWLVFCSMCFGGAMEATGFLQRITQPLVAMARSTGSLVAATAASCVVVNLTASDQYLAIVVPGRMFRKAFADRGLAPQNLSRTLEDAGTVTSPLIPWNTCGATQASVLGVAAFTYAPYAFFNWISPLMTILIAYLGIGIARIAIRNGKSDQ
jgi:Na+:H+ antiporter, NhaC family